MQVHFLSFPMIINGSWIKRPRWPVQPMSARKRNIFPSLKLRGCVGLEGRICLLQEQRGGWGYFRTRWPRTTRGVISMKSRQIRTCVDLHHGRRGEMEDHLSWRKLSCSRLTRFYEKRRSLERLKIRLIWSAFKSVVMSPRFPAHAVL